MNNFTEGKYPPIEPISDSNILIKDCESTFRECLNTMRRKNHDYADGSSFKNFQMSSFVGVTPQRGVLVRMMDKISRINTLLDKNPEVVDESVMDTLDDLINYSAILKSLIKNKVQ